MRKLIILSFVVGCIGFTACETAEDISYKLDHTVPSYRVLTDSLEVNPLQEVKIEVEVEDNGGLQKMELTYGDWNIRVLEELDELGYPKTYLFETTITIPEDAEKEWEEDFSYNDGTIIQITQQYHKLNLAATDKSNNVRNVPIYIKVK